MSKRTRRVFWAVGSVLDVAGGGAGGGVVVGGGVWGGGGVGGAAGGGGAGRGGGGGGGRRGGGWRGGAGGSGRGRSGWGAASGSSVGSGREGGWSEPAGGAVGGLEGGRGRQSGGQAQADLAGVVDDAGGDAEQHPAHELGLAAARQMPGRLGAEHQVVEQPKQVQRQRRAGQPDAVGVQVRQRQAPEADAELGVLDAFFDLRAVAMVMLDGRGGPVEVGQDEAVAVDDIGFAGQPEIELLARDRALAPGARVI